MKYYMNPIVRVRRVVWNSILGISMFMSLTAPAVAGVISGMVTDSSGTNKLNGILVEVYRVQPSSWPFVNSGTTDTNGHYSISFTGAGDYVVRFSDPARNYIDQFYNHADSFFTATSIPMTITGTNAGINALMDEVSRITGTVYDSDNVTPLSGIYVVAYRYSEEFMDWEEMASTSSDVDGNYELDGLTPDYYRVSFRDFTGLYLSGWYADARSVETADDVEVPLSTTVPGINVALSIASRISGTVLDSLTEAPLEGISVSAYTWNGFSWAMAGSAGTDENGDYEIGGLAEGIYRVQFVDGNGSYVNLVYYNAFDLDAGSDIDVGEAANVSGIDAAMIISSSISGTVSTTNLVPLANVEVSALRWNGFDWIVAAVGYTSEAGLYQIGGLAPGTYRMQFDGALDYGFPLWYYEQSLDLDSATDITIEAGSSTNGIDMAIYLPIPNAPPTNIVLSSSLVVENAPAGTVIGDLTTEDPDEEDSFTYELVTGDGDADNHLFDVDSHVLKTAAPLNYEAQSNRFIRIKSTDLGGLSVEIPMVITVTDVNEIPDVLTIDSDPSGGVVVQWSSISNQLFAMHGSTNSMATFELIAADLPATPPVNVYTVAAPAAVGSILKVTTED